MSYLAYKRQGSEATVKFARSLGPYRPFGLRYYFFSSIHWQIGSPLGMNLVRTHLYSGPSMTLQLNPLPPKGPVYRITSSEKFRCSKVTLPLTLVKEFSTEEATSS